MRAAATSTATRAHQIDLPVDAPAFRALYGGSAVWFYLPADDELDLAESSFLAALAKALEVPADAVAGLTLEVEVEELKQALATVRRGPPPIPGRRGDDVDVDLD